MAEEKESIQQTANTPQLDSGTYEILRGRLQKHEKQLRARMEKLNAARKEVFGSIPTTLLATERITTEHNCVPRDMVALGDYFIFGYNVHIGLKTETVVSDVFSVYEFKDHSFTAKGIELISNEQFESDFRDLYKYYKNTVFERFAVIGPYLYMVFQVGKSTSDIKTFKWLILDNGLKYENNRSDHEYKFPPQFEFEWKRATRDYHRSGKHPHVSILDKVFIETIGGDLTIKVEDNTDSGEGIYSEPVEDADQRLDDAEISYADLGNLILLRVKPFKENNFRHFVYNHKMKTAQRIDAISDSCVLLPDDQGIIFSKGYYLQTGEYKKFDNDLQNLKFDRKLVSSNGEDYLFVFYTADQGSYILLPYNLIEQKVESLITCHGYSFFPNGEMVYFSGQEEPARHHPLQVWQTPFVGKDYVPPITKDSYLFKIGNKDIVRCMAECAELITLLGKDDQAFSNLYLDIVKKAGDILDSYFWIREQDAFNPGEVITEIRNAASSAIEEFEKVVRIRKNTQEQLEKYAKGTAAILQRIKSERFENIDVFVRILSEVRTLRGEVIGLKDLRYTDETLIDKMEAELAENTDKVSRACVQFLLQEKALIPYRSKIEEQKKSIEEISTVVEAKKKEEELISISGELEMLIDIVSNLKIEDATQTTRIIDNISLLFSELNTLKAGVKNKRKNLNRTESTAEFHAQLKLVEQAVINYLDVSDSPEKCDEYLTKLMVQLEELEGKFSEFDDFINSLTEKREEVYDAFESKKLQIVEARNNRANSLLSTAERILKGAQNKVSQFKTAGEINGYFASDLMIDKVREIIRQLEEIKDNVKADDLQSRLKTLKEDTLRQLKDKQELFVEGADIVKFGSFHFSCNTQPLDLAIIHKDGEMYYHLTGTNFFEKVKDPEFLKTKPVWSQTLISENEEIYRAEYLAWKLYKEVVTGKGDTIFTSITAETLELMPQEELCKQIQAVMAGRYAEGYIKGVHDKDAAIILKALIKMFSEIGMLRYSATARAMGRFFWEYYLDTDKKESLNKRLKGAGLILSVFPGTRQFEDILQEINTGMKEFAASESLFNASFAEEASEYIFYELSGSDNFVVSAEAGKLLKEFTAFVSRKKVTTAFDESLQKLVKARSSAFDLARHWLSAFIESEKLEDFDEFIDEASVICISGKYSDLKPLTTSVTVLLEGFSGSHNVLDQGKYLLHFNRFKIKLSRYEKEKEGLFKEYLHLKTVITERFKEDLRLNEFKPRVLSSFVRNKLINEVYLPLLGANLAKQMGVAGENKRTDLMGMLLLISPPGYGKTTLMEYVASRLGIIFMKINGPAIGHKVTSLDPEEAPNAAAREEMEKLNLAFEMGDNVMIYLDDIQHCNPEFLQKFISLCDAQRKIEGVYKGKPKTYDFRGKKVCVVMAGNPYTESGEKFRIPDMLANRADTYNLGDIIGDRDEVFKLSYIENALTSSPVLNKLVSKSTQDIYSFLKFAETGDKSGLDFEGNYSTEEANEFVSVLKKIATVREVILKVNLEYIRSAGQADEFRTEPAFKMQGSYRNMNKIVERIVPLMNEQELKTLILSHYENEVQTLTTGAEANLLKFKELTGWLSADEKSRWEEIKVTFRKNQKLKGIDSSNQIGQVIAQLSELGEGMDGIREAIIKAASDKITGPGMGNGYAQLLAEIYKNQKSIQEEIGRQQNLLSIQTEERDKQSVKISEDLKAAVKQIGEDLIREITPVKAAGKDNQKVNEQLLSMREMATVRLVRKVFSVDNLHEFLTYHLEIENTSGKDIKMLAGSFDIYDALDNPLISVNLTFDKGIQKGGTEGYSIKTLYNKFVSSEVLVKESDLENLTIIWNPAKILFDDGEVVG